MPTELHMNMHMREEALLWLRHAKGSSPPVPCIPGAHAHGMEGFLTNGDQPGKAMTRNTADQLLPVLVSSHCRE